MPLGSFAAEGFIQCNIAKPFDRNHVKRTSETWSHLTPEATNDTRHRYLEGKNAIIPNMPRPTVKSDLLQHSYVSIQDCLRDFLGHLQERRLAVIGSEQEAPSCVTHPTQSTHAKHMLDLQSSGMDDANQNCLDCYFFFWSDDVEPNRLSKAGRGSVWLLTLTLGTAPGDAHNLNNTYPIAVGKKGDNHDAVSVEQSRVKTACMYAECLEICLEVFVPQPGGRITIDRFVKSKTLVQIRKLVLHSSRCSHVEQRLEFSLYEGIRKVDATCGQSKEQSEIEEQTN